SQVRPFRIIVLMAIRKSNSPTLACDSSVHEGEARSGSKPLLGTTPIQDDRGHPKSFLRREGANGAANGSLGWLAGPSPVGRHKSQMSAPVRLCPIIFQSSHSSPLQIVACLLSNSL